MRATFHASVAAALIACGLSSVAPAAERTVICEDFMADWCHYCPAVGRALSTLQTANPDRFIMVQVHANSDDEGVPWGTERMSFYGVTGYPTTWMDGTLMRLGRYPAAQYTTDFNARLNVPTDMVIDQWATQIDADSFAINARFALEWGATGPVTFNTTILQIREWYPVGTEYRNCMRTASPTTKLTLYPGETQTISWTCDLSAVDAAALSELGFIAYAQKAGTPQAGTAEMLQANRAMYPLATEPPALPPAPLPGDCDLDGHVTLTDLSMMLTSFGVTAGRSWGQGDFNGDHAVNLTDLATLLQNFGI